MNGHISFCGAFEAKCFMGAVENIFEQKYLSLREGLLIPDIILCVCVLSGPQQPPATLGTTCCHCKDMGHWTLLFRSQQLWLIFYSLSLISRLLSFVKRMIRSRLPPQTGEHIESVDNINWCSCVVLG